MLCCVCGVLGHLTPVHRCARSVCCVACAVSWATWLLFIGLPARCVDLLVRCPGPLGSCSPLCPLGVSCCVCGVLGYLAPVHWCACSVCCVACVVSWATWLLFTGVPARCVLLRVRCPRLLGSCSLVCPLGVLCCVCGVPGHLASVHRFARSVCCLARAVSWATGLLFTVVPARCVLLRMRCPGLLGSCSLVCLLCVLSCVCSVLGHLAPVHRCARSVCCVACAVSCATWLLFTDVPAWCVALGVRCPGPLDSCSPVCPLGALLSVCRVLAHFAPVDRFARSVCCVACAVSWATKLCSPVCPLCVLCCVCGVLGHLVPVHWCARSVLSFASAVSWATWLLFTGVPARCVVLRVRCPGPLGSCSPVCALRPLLCLSGVLGHLAPVHRWASSVCCVACAVSWATWLLFTGVLARCAVLRVRCPRPLGPCSPVCLLGALLCVCCVLGRLAPVHGCARSVCCVACAVSWATWLLFTAVPARCVVLWVACAVLRVQGVAVGRTPGPSGRRLLVAGRGWVSSKRALVHPDGGCFVSGRGWVSPVPGRAPPPPFRKPFFPPCPWPGVCLFPGGAVCRRVRGVSSSGLSAAAWSWWAALSRWASSGSMQWSFGVLLVGLVGVAHGLAMLGGGCPPRRWGCVASRLRGCRSHFPPFPLGGGCAFLGCGWLFGRFLLVAGCGFPPSLSCWFFFSGEAFCLFLLQPSLSMHWSVSGVVNWLAVRVAGGSGPCPSPVRLVAYVHSWAGGQSCWGQARAPLARGCASRFPGVMGQGRRGVGGALLFGVQCPPSPVASAWCWLV